MAAADLFLTWAVLFAFTAAYGLLRRRKLSPQIVAVGLATATLLTAVGAAFPLAPLSWDRVILGWLVHFALFSLAVRILTRSPWQASLGAGFFSATCLALLRIFY